jgi:hypothetical protein
VHHPVSLDILGCGEMNNHRINGGKECGIMRESTVGMKEKSARELF